MNFSFFFLTRNCHHVVILGGAGPADSQRLFAAGSVAIQSLSTFAQWWGALIEHADGTVLPYTVGHLEGVDPKSEFAGQELEELPMVESDEPSCLPYQRIHFVVDSDASVG